jgi:UDP-N-acetyl-D-glucosamine dehydrogenase
MEIQSSIKNNTTSVGIIGLGYVGLPLAVAFAEAGLNVVGYDIETKKIESIKMSLSYIEDVNDSNLRTVVKNNRLVATDKLTRLREVDAICICVPTPLNKLKDPVLTHIIDAAEALSKILKKGQLVILESTTYPGTTRELVLPILEKSNLKAGEDFYLAFSPERVDPVNKKFTIKNTPKLVGGINSISTDLACSLYRKIVDTVVPVSSMEVAEVTKLFENCFRLVNIAYVNEFAELCERIGVSIWEVIDSATTKPFGYMPFYPGPGIGGHCIPINPYFLFCKARECDFHIRFLELATGVTEQMPYSTASKVIEALSTIGKGIKMSSIFILGVSYKKDIGDLRGSPSIKLIELLIEKGADVIYNDPYIGKIEISGNALLSQSLTRDRLSSVDCVVIATDHSKYDYAFILDNAKLVFDTRGITRGISQKYKNIVRLGEGILKTQEPMKTPEVTIRKQNKVYV